MSAAPGLLAFFIGALFCAPRWSSTLPASDYPLVIVLGMVFGAIGVVAALPESWQRLRALSFALYMATFGLVCAALALTPLDPAADATLTIGGIAGFASSAPMPGWARIIAGFFAIVCLGAAALGLWGVVREFFGRRSDGGGDSPA
jgi:hypothetical protein